MVSALASELSDLQLVQTLARVIALCSWARHLTLTVTVSLFTQVYKCVPTKLMLGAYPAMN